MRNLPQPPISNEKHSYKFTSDEILQIIHWIGEFKKEAEVKELVSLNFNKTISHTTFNYYKTSPKWQATIQKDRERYAAEMFKVELSNERRRVEELEENYWLLKDDKKIKEANSTLHEIHEQLQKPKDFNVQNNYQLNIYKEFSEEDFDKRELELIQKRKLLKGEI